MMKSQRIKAILDYVRQQESASIDELVEVFNVSKNTIRRDIQELAEAEKITKIHGGVSISNTQTVPYQDRKVKKLHEKKLLAQLAAQFVEDDDIIFIDSGTTTQEMLEFIKDKKITIITNNLDFTLDAAYYPNLSIYSMGGMFERSTRSYVGTEGVENLCKYNFNKAFMASTGISLPKGITNSAPLETPIKAKVIDRSEKVFILVDHSKFGKYSLTTYCDFNQIDYLVTDRKPDDIYLDNSKEYNYKILYPEK